MTTIAYNVNRVSRIRIALLLVVLALVAHTDAAAQSMANYSVSRTTGNSYNSIVSSGLSVPSWRNTTGGNFNLDDNRSFPMDIGFDFWYRGVRYTTFAVSTNGYMDFSASTANGGPVTTAYGYQNTAFTNNASGTLNAIAPFYDDLMTQGGVDPLGESIKYLTSGVAPNRVLTVEWINMTTYSNTTPNLNFQVKLYESSGVIEFNYGTMNNGTMTFSYTNGINGPTQSATTTASEALIQQTANTATYNNTETNNLTAMPASGSRHLFAPQAITAPTGLNFTSVGQISMQLNWTDNATNEVGYAIYRSDDGGATYNYIAQTAANATSYIVSGLLAGTTYYYRVYGVNEGRLSSALSGSQATASPGSPYTITSGSWKNSAIWSTGSVPGISDNAVISDGHTVTIDSLVTVNSLTIGNGTSGTLLIGNDNTARSITVIGNIDVLAGGTFQVNSTSNTSAHTIAISGNINNAGTFNLQTDGDSRASITFNKNGTQSVNGNGATTNFYLMVLNMGSTRSNILDIFATNFSAPTANFLTLNNGTFNLATGATITPFTGNSTISSTTGIRINHASAVLITTGGSLTISGEIRVNNGTVNIGNAAGNNLISSGGIFVFNGGTTKVAGGFIPSSAFVITDFTMNAGTLIVADVGSNNTTYAPFNVSTSGSVFRMYGGSIIIKNEGGTGTQDLGYVVTGLTSSTVTGGTIQFGQSGLTSVGQVMRINTNIPIYNLSVNSTNATAQIVTSGIAVLNNVSITEGVLNANTFDITVGGNWTNSSQTFTPSTGRVTFNGSGAQSITDAAGETFNKLIISKTSGTITLNSNVTVSDSFQLTLGTMDVSSSTLTLNGGVSGGGTLLSGSAGTVNYNQSAPDQQILTANYGNLTFSSFRKLLPAATIGIAGAFTSGSAEGHTITGNTIHFNGTGAQNISYFLYNNLTVSNGGTKTLQTGADSVIGNLTIGSGTALATGLVTLNIFGNVSNLGSQNGSGAVVLRGSSVQSVTGGGPYQNLTINNANGIVLNENTVVNGALTFTAGIISTGTDTLTIASSGSVSRTSGHVNGWLKKNVATGTNVSRTFEIGDAAVNYTPVSFTFGSVTSAGDIAVSTFNSEDPEINTSFIDPTDNVNRYWKIVNSGGFAYNVASQYSAIFTFINPGDLDVTTNTSIFRVNVWKGTQWDSTTAGIRTATTTEATNIDSLGEFVVGVQVTAGAYRSKATGNWNSTSTWERFNGTTWVNAGATPTSTDGLITIRTGHTVTVTANVTIDQTIVETGGQITINGGNLTLAAVNNALTVYGTLRWQGNTLSGATAARLNFNAGSVYQHAMNNASQVAIPTASWHATSTCEITGATTSNATFVSAASLSQNFGNFTWNSPGQSGNIILNGLLNNISGTLTVTNTNGPTRYLALYNGNAGNTSIGGNLTVNGANAWVKLQDGTSSPRFYIGGDINVSNGILSLTDRNAVVVEVTGGLNVTGGTFRIVNRNATIDSVYIKGNLVHTSGIITNNGTTGSGTIAFNGTSRQTFTGGGTVTGTVNYSVLSGSTVSLGTNTMTGNIFNLQTGATLEIGSPDGITASGATGNIQVTGTRTYSTGANYVYNGSSSQFTGNGLPATVNKLEINNSSGVILSGSVSVADSVKLLNGILDIVAATLTINNIAFVGTGSLTSSPTGTVIYNKNSNGQDILIGNYGNLTLSNFNKTFPAATIGISGTFAPGTATGHTVTGNTIDFNGTTVQSIVGWLYYNNLTVSGSNWKQLTGDAIVNGNLSVSGATLSDSIYTMTVKGDITNTSIITGTSNLGKTRLSNGASAHTLSGSGSYWILELSDANGAILASDIIIDSLLVLTNGIVSAGGNTVICNDATGIYRPFGGGHVNGKVRKSIGTSAVPQNYTFEIGDAVNYTPIDMTFASVSVAGTVTAFQTPIDHPLVKYSGLDQDKSVNRFFTLSSGGGLTFTTYDATFNFVPGDLDAGANTAYFFVKRYTNPSWFPSTINVRLSTSTRALGITGFGEYAIGEASSIFYWTKGAGTYNWGDDYNWSSHSIPTSGNTVIFDGKDTIDVNIDGVCKDLIIQNDTLRLTILPTKSLTVNGNLTQYSGQFSTKAAFPTVTGTVSLQNGSLFGYDATNGTQNVAALPYRNLRISGGGTKTAVGAFTVNRNIEIGAGTTFDDGGFVVTVKDSLINNGIHSGSGKILLNGTTQHRMTGTGSFANLELNNSSNGVTLDSSITVNGTLTLTNGIIAAPNDTLSISSTGIVNRGGGFIFGNLRKYFSAGATSKTFEIGSLADYLPVTVTFGTVNTGGYLTVQMLTGYLPDTANAGLHPDSTIKRYWILNNNGIQFTNYSAEFSWSSADVPSGVTDFSELVIVKRDNGIWNDAESGSITATSAQTVNNTSFSTFGIGIGRSATLTSIQTGNWDISGTWDLGRVPKKRDNVILAAPWIVTLAGNSEISGMEIQSGAEFADAGYTLDLYGNLNFNGTWSGTGAIRWNLDAVDSLYGMNGTASGTSTLIVNGNGKRITATDVILDAVQIAAGDTVENRGSIQLSVVIGDDASSTWINGQNSSVTVTDAMLATGTLAASSSTNTVNYGGSGAQSIKSAVYHHLQTANSGTKTISGNIAVKGDVTIGAGTTVAASSTIDTVYGNWTNNGTFTPSTSTIVFAGSGSSTITGETAFSTLSLNKNDSTTAVNMANNITAVTLSMIKGMLLTGVSTVTITGSRNGNGVIIGTITRTHLFSADTPYAFESPFNTVNFFNAGTLPSSVTVQVVLDSAVIVNTAMNPINRYYVVSQTGGSGTQYRLQLHYNDSELGSANSETTPPLKLWREDGGTWIRLGSSANNTVENWVRYDTVMNFGTFSLSSRTVTNVMLQLSANATHPAPGDEVEYTVAYSNDGDGPATNFVVVAPIPMNTTYVVNSITVNGTPTADGSPGIVVAPAALTINLSTVLGGAVAPNSSGFFKYKVTIN
jgi:post-segregation antitoxin (ccd killing protein)